MRPDWYRLVVRAAIAWVLATTVVFGLVLLAGQASAEPHGQGECGHGNSGRACVADPQPDHGQDCGEHGRSGNGDPEGGVNEDHCAGADPTASPTPEPSTSVSPTPTTSAPTTDPTLDPVPSPSVGGKTGPHIAPPTSLAKTGPGMGLALGAVVGAVLALVGLSIRAIGKAGEDESMTRGDE